MPDPDDFDNTIVEVAVENIIESSIDTIQAVDVTFEDAERVEVEVTSGSMQTVETVVQTNEVAVYQGDLFFSDIEEEILSNIVRKTEFTVTDPDDNKIWFLPSDARQVLHVMINQIDYISFCELTPIGSGRIVYTPANGGYEPEVGDKVIIYWLR